MMKTPTASKNARLLTENFGGVINIPARAD